MHDLIFDLQAYNDWANRKVLQQCHGLTDEQFDTEREMGLGTLRRTLFHLLSAETIWMERWRGLPWRTFPTDPNGASSRDIANGLARVSDDRLEFLQGKSSHGLNAIVAYEDSRQNTYRHRLADLLLHVFHHGIHHRAQALNYLRQFDRTIPVGIDYIYFRISGGASPQSPEAIVTMQRAGLAVAKSSGQDVRWNTESITRCFSYHDWANACVLSWAAELNDDQLATDLGIGHGSIRSTLLHLYDVERWWLSSLMEKQNQFGQSSDFASVDELTGHWMGLRTIRDQFLSTLSHETANQAVDLNFGGPTYRFQIIEGVLQIVCHATHHRAQLINMLRHSGCDVNNIDLIYALASLSNVE